MSNHKKLGQVFTPSWIVNEILDSVGYFGESILDKYILEPSSGDGAFLIEIANRYIDVCLSQGINNYTIKNRLEKYIYAIELDTKEFDKSIQNLNKLVYDKIKIKENIDWKFYNSNTLFLYKKYLNYFDFVVGNPPYIRIHNLDINTRKTLKENFLFSEGTFDIYLSFFEMGLQMLKENGYLGYITPNSFLHNSSYNLFR
uniref:Eco57I restriction-modification methylase domain-containing protein n=1 Tax=Persicitalea sp. TaxID=3100273 RepID=UPI0035947382